MVTASRTILAASWCTSRSSTGSSVVLRHRRWPVDAVGHPAGLAGWLATITTWTPSFQIADSAQRILGGATGIPGTAAAVFTVWTAAFVRLALPAFRRSASTAR